MMPILRVVTGRWTIAFPGIVVAGLCTLVFSGCGFSPALGDATEPITRNQPVPSVEDTLSDVAQDDPSRDSEDGSEAVVASGKISDEPEQNGGESEMFKFASTAPVVREVDHADDGSFSQKVLQADQPVLVDFYADWCGPCRRLAPVLEDVAQEVPEARVVKVNVDHAPSVARKYGISSIPALIVFRNGQPVANHTGVASKGKLKQMLQQ